MLSILCKFYSFDDLRTGRHYLIIFHGNCIIFLYLDIIFKGQISNSASVFLHLNAGEMNKAKLLVILVRSPLKLLKYNKEMTHL